MSLDSKSNSPFLIYFNELYSHFLIYKVGRLSNLKWFCLINWNAPLILAECTWFSLYSVWKCYYVFLWMGEMHFLHLVVARLVSRLVHNFGPGLTRTIHCSLESIKFCIIPGHWHCMFWLKDGKSKPTIWNRWSKILYKPLQTHT